MTLPSACKLAPSDGRCLPSRSREEVSSRLGRGANGAELTCESAALKNPTHIHNISENYEAAIQRLMSVREHPDLTLSELELFRDKFSGHAYPCRFASCTYATNGFRNNDERVAHEIKHTPRFPCVEPGCQYPPFGSSRALKRHQSDCHGKRSGRLRVRAAVPLPDSQAYRPYSRNP